MKARLLRLTAVLAAVLLVFSFLLPNTQKVHAAAADQYAYSQLTPEQQYVYDQIVACVEARKPSADLDENKGVLVGDIESARDAVLLDRPDLFWFTDVPSVRTVKTNNTEIVVSFITSYEINGVKVEGSSQELTNAINAFKTACNEILNSIPLWATSEYDKALYLHDAVAANPQDVPRMGYQPPVRVNTITKTHGGLDPLLIQQVLISRSISLADSFSLHECAI